MVELSAAQITGIVSLFLVLSGTVAVSNMSQSYYCEPEDSVRECLHVSSSGLTCYYLGAEDLTKGDRCVGGTWEELSSIEKDNNVPAEEVQQKNRREWSIVSPDGKVCFLRGNLRQPMPCGSIR